MTRLGRNPFEQAEKKTAPKKPVSSSERPASFTPASVAAKKPLTTAQKLMRFLQVDLPAEGFILGLKAALLLRSTWD
jgi:hypothetical protein